MIRVVIDPRVTLSLEGEADAFGESVARWMEEAHARWAGKAEK